MVTISRIYNYKYNDKHTYRVLLSSNNSFYIIISIWQVNMYVHHVVTLTVA